MATRTKLSLEVMGAKLAAVFNDADLHDAKETLRECLMATRTQRTGRDGQGHVIYEELPDYPIRVMAAVKIIEWTVGKPISRTIHAEIPNPDARETGKATDGLLDLLLAAPDAAADIIAKLKIAAEKAKKAEPIELAPEPPVPEPPAAGS